MKTFFDLLITLGILITILPASFILYSIYKRPTSWESLHKKTSIFLASFLLFGTTVLTWGSFIEPHIIVIHPHEIDLPKIEKPIRIAFIADMQIGTYKGTAWTQKIVDETLLLHPDVVFLGGDNVDNMFYNEKEVDELRPLEQLAKQIPTYAIHGNHEYGIGSQKSLSHPGFQVADMSMQTKKVLESLGIIYLVNDLEEIQIKNQNFYLFGGDSFWAGKLDFSILKNRNKDIPTLALVHNPSFISQPYPTDVDIYLSGHTHGGQIRLPFIGPIGRVDNFLPARLYKGLHTLATGPQLLVTSGIGETGTRARLFNPPEIVLLTIK